MVKATGSTSVMASSAGRSVEGDDAQTKLWRQLEFFPTPPWAARAGGELIKLLDPLAEDAWDPCCGQGHMVHGLKDYFRAIHRTDIHDYGWDGLNTLQDFTAPERGIKTKADWVIANPPFSLAGQFVERGLQRARRGVAILQRSTWLSSAGRYRIFFREDDVCVVEAKFFERPAMVLGRWEPGASTATDYSWFLFIKPEAAPLNLRALGRAFGHNVAFGFSDVRYDSGPMLMAIPPGTKEQLTRPDDAALFGAKTPMPLLDGAA